MQPGGTKIWSTTKILFLQSFRENPIDHICHVRVVTSHVDYSAFPVSKPMSAPPATSSPVPGKIFLISTYLLAIPEFRVGFKSFF